MDEYTERVDRLEPLKTLHETRANDQYGKLLSLSQDTFHWRLVVEALVFEIPAKLASKVLG